MRREDIMPFAISESQDIARYLSGVSCVTASSFADEIIGAKRIFIGGAGRSFLPMKMLAMRLMQLGLETYLAGEVCTPGVKVGDLFIAASCSGTTEITCMQANKARAAGARLAIITAGEDKCIAECLVRFPDPFQFQEGWNDEMPVTRATIRSPKSLFESALLMFSDAIVEYLKGYYNMTHADMHKNHANLE